MAAVDPEWLRGLVLRAGSVLEQASQRRHELRVDHKGRVDLVTEIDLEIQELLVTELKRNSGTDCIVAEEGDRPETGECERVWYVDPVDGTTNFVHGYPFSAVSVARWVGGEPEVGIVYAPLLDELFFARAGRGATLERPGAGQPPRAIQASSCASLDDALLATGFPYHRGKTARLNLAICAHALDRVRGIRRAGSAALDICHVALGRLDGYWEMGLAPWDFAAAALIAREAGAVVSDFRGTPELLEARRIVAAAPRLHGELIGLLQRAHARPDLDVLGAAPDAALPLHGLLPGEC